MDNTEAFENLGTISHYNGFIFGNMDALQADCEGALAVGGIFTYGSTWYGYEVGAGGVEAWASIMIGKYENPNNYPSLLLGGTFSEESTQLRVYTGHTMLRENYLKEFNESGFSVETNSVNTEKDDVIKNFFSYVYDQVRNSQFALLSASVGKITFEEIKHIRQVNHSKFLVENLIAGKKMLIYNLDCDSKDSITLGEMDFDSFVDSYHAIIFNIPEAKRVHFTGGAILYNGAQIDTSSPSTTQENILIQKLAAKLYFNMPNAEEVVLDNYGLIGGLMAPNATVSGEGGSINGMLTCKHLKQDKGMELHAFKIVLGEEMFTLDPPVGSARLIKIDEDTREGLEGAVFNLYKYDYTKEIYSAFRPAITTGPDGSVVIKDLEVGKYRLYETKPPKGYALMQGKYWEFEITIDNEGNVNEMQTIYIENALKKGTVDFLKVDFKDNSITLSGAEFELYMYDEDDDSYILVKTGLTTGSDGKLEIENLKPGHYKLLETASPDGYYLPEDFYIEFDVILNASGDIEVPDTIEITNQHLLDVEIIKVDENDQQRFLPGAKFSVHMYDEDINDYVEIIAEVETGSNGKIKLEDLAPGKYKLVEEVCPEGFYLPEDPTTYFEIKLDEEGIIIPLNPITITNILLGKVQFYKIDAEDDKLFLEGAEFDLYKLNKETGEYELVESGLVTDEDGSLLIEGLEPGDYKLVETKAPHGYEISNEETTFTVTL